MSFKIGIIEKDCFGDVICIWKFPSLNEDEEAVAISRNPLSNPNLHSKKKKSFDEQASIRKTFLFSKYSSFWIYSLSEEKIEPKNATSSQQQNEIDKKEMKGYSVVVFGKDFLPEKYEGLLNVLLEKYKKEKSPSPVLSMFLETFSKAKCEGFDAKNYDPKKSRIQISLKDELLVKFGKDTFTTLWRAYAMKKRIVIFSSRVDDVQKIIRTMPQLCFHRQNIDLLRPLVANFSNEYEIKDLKDTGIYIVGTVDKNVKSDHSKLWDVLLDCTSNSIVISEDAIEDFEPTTKDSEIKKVLDDNSDASKQAADLIKDLAMKTREIITELNSFKGDEPKLTKEILSQKNFDSATERFFWNLVVAENL